MIALCLAIIVGLAVGIPLGTLVLVRAVDWLDGRMK